MIEVLRTVKRTLEKFKSLFFYTLYLWTRGGSTLQGGGDPDNP
jgi:hypothetical protein